MVCSKCGSPMLVIDSRENEGQSRRRRYKCPFCDERITMYEVTKEEYEGIIKEVYNYIFIIKT